MPTEEELHKVRFEFDPAPELETLMLHFCGEIRLNHWYRCAADWHTEPVIKAIYRTVAKDEARHAGAYLQYMRRALHDRGDQTSLQARQSFAKIGVLMASGQPHRAGHASDQPARQQGPVSPTTRCSRACPSRVGWSTGSTPRSVSTAPGRARSPPASCTSRPSCSIASSTASRT